MAVMASERMSPARRRHTSRRRTVGQLLELIPSRQAPRRMKGITVVCSSWLAANPMLASVPRSCMLAAIHANTGPPRLSTAPAQTAFSSGLTRSKSMLERSMTSAAPRDFR